MIIRKIHKKYTVIVIAAGIYWRKERFRFG